MEKINLILREHETSTQWELAPLTQKLYHFFDLFNSQFFNSFLPQPAISFQKTGVIRYGHYRLGRNDFGILHEINLNRRYLTRNFVELLVTLLHEMIHLWQDVTKGMPKTMNYHNKGFQEKSKELGIPSNHKGQTTDVTDPFVSLVMANLKTDGDKPDKEKDLDIDKVKEEITKDKKPKGESKLKKYSCGCTNVRVGTSRFSATCNFCGNEFVLV